jgi:hypothetical protein
MRNPIEIIRRGNPVLEDFQTVLRAFGSKESLRPAGLALVHAMVCRSSLPVIETGSGVSTAIIGFAAERAGVAVHAIEHDERFLEKTTSLLERLKIKSVTLHYAPLTKGKEYSWPDLPSEFGAALIDGPISERGRVASVRHLADALKNATVMLDDVEMLSQDSLAEVQKLLPHRMTIVNDRPEFAVFTKGREKRKEIRK